MQGLKIFKVTFHYGEYGFTTDHVYIVAQNDVIARKLAVKTFTEDNLDYCDVECIGRVEAVQGK